jgi:hypothetical protein
MPRKTNVSETPAPRSKAAAPPAAPKRHLTAQDIATLAFSYWEQRGFSGGSPQADWFRAERELRSAQSQA